MKKRSTILPALCLLASLYLPGRMQAAEQAPRPVKNIVLMIPDGTSVPVLSLSRWYRWRVLGGEEKLAVDPYLCGLVKTHCSDSPIGDSAPTTSTYMTGQRTRTGHVSMYPPQNPDNDIYPVDPERQYQPLTTLAEAGRQLKGKSTGIVFTCEFPHATPADVTAHYYDRNAYPVLARQMVHNDIDVVLGGGTAFLTPEYKKVLEQRKTTVLTDDPAGMRRFQGNKLWALFGAKAQPYDLDRDTSRVPSLAEMTRKALSILSQNENGFFLMVEGSKVDWAAHANDPMGMITEFLAFDEAVREAMLFARTDGETLVVVVPDHGNSGISIGNRSLSHGYDTLPLERLLEPFRHFRTTAQGMADRMNIDPTDSLRPLFRRLLNIDLTDAEVDSLYRSRDYRNSPLPPRQRDNRPLQYRVGDIMSSRTLLGFTTNGHTGEDVFLAAYHPQGDIPRGLLTHVELNAYLTRQFGLEGALDSLTAENFVSHRDVFRGMDCRIEPAGSASMLTVKGGKGMLTISGNTDTARLNGKEIRLGTLAVYVDRNDTFYVPRRLRKLLE